MLKSLAYPAATVLAAAALMACSPPDKATAEPPGFPDLNTYAEVPVDQYVSPVGRGMTSVFFSTSEGVNCGFAHPANPNGQNQQIQCWGPLPGLQNIAAEGSGPCDTGTVNMYGIGHRKSECKDNKPTSKILSPGQKVSYGNVTCGVGDGGSVACIERVNPERGFVLQPSGSFSF
ncbi:Uncharacterised protein [Mycobacteroides abscessus subsp. bolletii]|uniref:Lipoprotein LppI n=2 Tax=Mycobacteroides abscessus TaxID=36809 RepID=A0ABD7HF75_9MYCO|nr:hypothetical protein DDT46_13375 [Mycobacteroides abscessus]SHP03948.1 Uncharacterised protein [Mycobacteroides abscessus subsp. bolletii]PVA60786.1 hypothetical protein DDJ37_24620 [Mycobacteroides abscessus]PVB11009.1 hypothetical protein DDJ71_23840 [Mycobacteroides abscessus]PVB18500.1 hypothetical protein DDJ40_01165 [Mycobacteroides abscessus]